MKYQNNKTKISSLLLIFAIFVCVSCNKDFEEPAAPTNPTSGQTIWQIINAGSNYTILKAAIARADSGQVGTSRIDSILNTNGNSLTLFAVDDNAFALSGISPLVIAALPATELQEILSYHIIPNALPSASIPTTFPNTEMPTLLQLDPTNPLIRMNIFPWKNGAGNLYVNNIPVTTADQLASNGVIHNVAAIVNPPSELLAQIIYGDPDLTYFTAAIARADSGQVGLNKFDSLLKYPLVNMTVLAPTDSAFQAILYGEIYGALLQEGVPSGTAAAEAGALSSSPTVFSNPALYSVLTAATVQGIVAYHILAIQSDGSYQPVDRVFSVNFPTDPGQFVKTLVNASTVGQAHPGIMAQATFTGPFVTSLQFTGLGTFPPGGTPYSGGAANTITFDEIGVNGVVHKIDKVLLPQ
ncbi:MAG TPA: fasciclin domain-containing protein [Puia sp.]|jgi:uncharacterized surface protein with fasciclin (FAS1) repeats|nr:fasciclin domain-containing protein [Puia sp.]